MLQVSQTGSVSELRKTNARANTVASTNLAHVSYFWMKISCILVILCTQTSVNFNNKHWALLKVNIYSSDHTRRLVEGTVCGAGLGWIWQWKIIDVTNFLNIFWPFYIVPSADYVFYVFNIKIVHSGIVVYNWHISLTIISTTTIAGNGHTWEIQYSTWKCHLLGYIWN